MSFSAKPFLFSCGGSGLRLHGRTAVTVLDLSQGTPGFALTLVCSRILACVIELFELRKGVFKTTANGHCFVECAEVKTFLDRDVAGRVLRNAFLGCAEKSLAIGEIWPGENPFDIETGKFNSDLFYDTRTARGRRTN